MGDAVVYTPALRLGKENIPSDSMRRQCRKNKDSDSRRACRDDGDLPSACQIWYKPQLVKKLARFAGVVPRKSINFPKNREGPENDLARSKETYVILHAVLYERAKHIDCSNFL